MSASTTTDPNQYPPGWNAERVADVLRHYEGQSPDEAAAEDEAAMADVTETVMGVPTDLVPAIRDLIAKRQPA